MEPAVDTSDSTSSASLRTSRAKPPAVENVAVPLTGSVWARAGDVRAISSRPAASHDGPPRQRRAIRAPARLRDQNPAAAVRAIPTGLSASTIKPAAGPPHPAFE